MISSFVFLEERLRGFVTAPELRAVGSSLTFDLCLDGSGEEEQERNLLVLAGAAEIQDIFKVENFS